MGSNTFPQQQFMGQMPQEQQMDPSLQQQDQQTGFAGMYSPQYNMQGYGGGQSVPNYTPQATQQAPQAPQAMPNYQVQQQQVAGYGGYQGPQRLY